MSAHLCTTSSVGRTVVFMQAHIALARNCHAQCSMGKHLYADELALRSTDLLGYDLLVYLFHLIHVQLACQYHHIGKLSIELQCLDVGDVELSGKMHLNARLAVGTIPATGIHQGSNIAGNDGCDA